MKTNIVFFQKRNALISYVIFTGSKSTFYRFFYLAGLIEKKL